MTAGREPLRVAFFGNVANTGLRAVTALRAQGVDAHLYVSTTDGPASRPENADPALADGYPDWIHEGRWITAATVLAPWRAPVVRELARYDVLVASGPAPIFAQFAGRPWCLFVTGADLTVKPFPWTFRRWYDTWPHRAAELVAGCWQRRAIRRADQVWMQPFRPMVDAADRLGVAAERRAAGSFPIVVDTDGYGPDAPVSDAARRYVDEALGDASFVVFHPSRLVMERRPELVRTGQWKGNDTLLRGFAELVARTGDRDAVLVLIDTPLSRDVGPARELLAELGVADQVRWLVPPDGRILDRDHMVALYQRADVVVDEFGVGWFGYVALEGLAAARPVLGRLDAAAMAQLYPDHPMLHADDPAEVADHLAALRADPAAAAARGAEGRAWVERHHSAAAAAGVYGDAVARLAR